jgi:hypothetical protein
MRAGADSRYTLHPNGSHRMTSSEGLTPLARGPRQNAQGDIDADAVVRQEKRSPIDADVPLDQFGNMHLDGGEVVDSRSSI